MSYPKGISASTKVVGGTIYLAVRFKDRRYLKSSGTTNAETAKSFARELAKALDSPDNVPNGLPQEVYDFLEIQPEKKLRDAVTRALAPRGLRRTTIRHIPDIDAELKAIEAIPLPRTRKPVVAKFKQIEIIIGSNMAEARKAFIELMEKYDDSSQRAEYWHKRCLKAEAALGRKISDAELKAGPRTLKEALADFLDPAKSTLPPKGQTRYQVTKWLERFVADKGELTDVNRLDSAAVIEHLAKYQDRAKLSDLYCYVCKFMDFASFSSFDRKPVKEWYKPRQRAKKAAKRAEQWFWLKNEDALKIIKQMRDHAGDYWADAATLQYGCGFRPEELPLLLTRSVRIDGDSASIALVAPEGYRLKTDRSHDAVNVPKFAIPALKRRLAAAKGKVSLFPLSHANVEVWTYIQKKMTPEAVKMDLWPNADDHFWSEMYLPRLRDAAKAAKLDDVTLSKLDSKTLRHTCGRELILEHGYEAAAAVLRHDVTTLRAHYADLKTSDVSTDR